MPSIDHDLQTLPCIYMGGGGGGGGRTHFIKSESLISLSKSGK